MRAGLKMSGRCSQFPLGSVRAKSAQIFDDMDRVNSLSKITREKQRVAEERKEEMAESDRHVTGFSRPECDPLFSPDLSSLPKRHVSGRSLSRKRIVWREM